MTFTLFVLLMAAAQFGPTLKAYAKQFDGDISAATAACRITLVTRFLLAISDTTAAFHIESHTPVSLKTRPSLWWSWITAPIFSSFPGFSRVSISLLFRRHLHLLIIRSIQFGGGGPSSSLFVL